ncbi:MAG: hypothetical protein AB8H03_08020 [Saprospiraceae bacterium]
MLQIIFRFYATLGKLFLGTFREGALFDDEIFRDDSLFGNLNFIPIISDKNIGRANNPASQYPEKPAIMTIAIIK